jgi:hypothetical protein
VAAVGETAGAAQERMRVTIRIITTRYQCRVKPETFILVLLLLVLNGCLPFPEGMLTA